MSVIVSTKNQLSWAGSSAPTYVPEGIPLVYAADGDTNGAFYYIATSGGTTGWTNPVTAQLVSIVASTTTSNTVDTLVDRAPTAFYVQTAANNFLGIDLGAKRSLGVTQYTIRARSESSHNMKNWKLQGSDSVAGNTASAYLGAVWEDIDERVNDTFLINADTFHTYTCNLGNKKKYRWLRILQNGLNHSSDNYLCLGEFEFYGSIKVLK